MVLDNQARFCPARSREKIVMVGSRNGLTDGRTKYRCPAVYGYPVSSYGFYGWNAGLYNGFAQEGMNNRKVVCF